MSSAFSIKKSFLDAKIHTCVALCIFVADRILKWYTLHSLSNEGVFWIPGWLGLERYKNTGIAFSLPVDRVIILIATLVIVISLVQNILRHYPSKQMIAALSFLVLGAASNFYDRLAFGYVIDYLRIGPLSLINAADGMVIIGILIILSDYKRTKQKKSQIIDIEMSDHEHL